ncbi:MAG: antibiotic biosynthesis monooxygenase family protein [Bacteroidota bacterium]
MIKRIVKMTFQAEAVETFLRLFAERQAAIRAFPGCEHLELWRDQNDPHRFFTYSFWQHPDDLETYRHSELFRDTWAQTKILFAAKPEAWSVTVQ